MCMPFEKMINSSLFGIYELYPLVYMSRKYTPGSSICVKYGWIDSAGMECLTSYTIRRHATHVQFYKKKSKNNNKFF